MPLGFERRFKYSTVGVLSWSTQYRNNARAEGKIRPCTGYDAVYTYRSGKRSKNLDTGGVYGSQVSGKGNLYDRLAARKQYLEHEVRNILSDGRSGNVSVFSDTDTGHPFASFKIRSNPIFADMESVETGYPKAISRWRVILADTVSNYSIPNVDDIFGGSTNGTPYQRYSDFTWPVGYPSRQTVPAKHQVINQTLHKSMAAGLIASTNPWASKASLLQTVLELMKGDVPTVLRNIRRHMADVNKIRNALGNIGDEYLNIQFGWAPLFKDIVAATEVLFKLHMLLHSTESSRRYRGGELGNWYRSNTNLPASSTGVNYDNHHLYGAYTAQMSPGHGVPATLGPPRPSDFGGLGSNTTIVNADWRFSGRFHKGCRPTSRELGFVERALSLLGLEPKPSVVWELTPWTWLLDWGSNLGSIAQNLSDLDWSNVLLDYAYLTYCIKAKYSYSLILDKTKVTMGNLTHSVSSYQLGSTVESIEKIREQASPFGFSVGWSGLSPYQLSILAALGMSRGR